MADLIKLKEAGIDTDAGLAYCADDPEFYEEMLAEFVNEAAGRTAAMQDCFDAADWGGYAINAHSLKSTSRIIGAAAVSEKARELEMAAKAADAGSIAELHGGFLAEISALTESIGASLG